MIERFWLVPFLMAALTQTLRGEEVSGKIENPNQTYGSGVNIKLVGDTTFGWKLGKFTGDLDLNGHEFTMETGGGNVTAFSGAITGKGHFRWNGGGNTQWQMVPSFLTGKKPNTFTGTLTVLRGTLALAKPRGVSAFSGEQLVLGGGTNQAILRLDASHQLGDSCRVLMTGKHEARILTQAHSESLGALELKTFGYIDLGERESSLHFADSSKVEWDLTKTLTIQNWTDTHGDDEVFFGTTGAALTPKQIARIGFENPSDCPEGLYSARLTTDGRLVPNRANGKVAAIDPPFDVSDQARAARWKLYEIPGREQLGGANTPLTDGTRISFFGDSITWQNAYINEIQKALKIGVGTKGLSVKLFNHGINGGGVLSVRDGSEKAAYVDSKNTNGKQAPFADVIKSDRTNVAVVFIGINDVWWRKTSPADFEKALRDIVAAAKAHQTKLVLATLSVYQEKPDGSNPMDAKCDQYAEITRKVARSTATTLVDLRRVFLAYLRNHNAQLRIDGSMVFSNTGVLTYDGVHPNAIGNALIADLISQGIYDGMRKTDNR
ncbi:MAG: GDSL-type esterase/lipase family protein [Planctomycetota bacterium]|nr:GDSL-type esterase/lipase family protein [Planctomycetota bacterium]